MDTHADSRLRFGAFELDTGSRELRSAGGTVRLQEQPFVILRMLVERRGQVVTREELRGRLWPDGTFVDFEHSLNAAIKRLRAALGDDADSPKFVETIPRRGYRFMADQDDADVRTPGQAEWRVRLAVLPFSELNASPHDDYFGHGFTEEMISELGRRGRGRLAVISSHSSRTFKDASVRARDIGQALRADYLLEGGIRRGGGRVRITARLVETSSETQLWVETYEQPLTDWLVVQADIATRIAASLAMELLPADPFARPASRDDRAHQSFLKARYHYERPADIGVNEARHFFQDAAARDPSFAAAHAGVAMVEVMRAMYYHETPRIALERARDAAERALRLGPALPDSHRADGDVKWLLLWDPRGARAAYTRAVALNPALDTARVAHARLLVSLGRFAQAIREADLGREIDPRCLAANTAVAWARYGAGDYDAAIDLCRDTLEMDEGYPAARQMLGAALLAAGRRKEAVRVLEGGGDDPPPDPVLLAALAHARGVTGDHPAALALIDRLDEVASRRYVSPYAVAVAYVGVGRLDAAFTALARACDDRDPGVTNIAVEPRLAPIRSDPRYTQLLVRLGLHEFHAR